MAYKRLLFVLVLALFATILVACELSASTPPPQVSPTAEGSMGTLEAVLGNIATQTAAAGGVAPTAPVATQPAPTAAAETPAATEVPEEPAEPTQAPQPEEEEPEPEPEEEEEEPQEVPTVEVPSTYTLQEGEFPFCIARRFDINQYELLNANNLTLNSRPGVGFQLRIPSGASGFAGDRELQSHPTTYTVGAGETIYEIACKFGDVTPEAIAAVNNLDSPFNLEAGQELDIP